MKFEYLVMVGPQIHGAMDGRIVGNSGIDISCGNARGPQNERLLRVQV